MLCLQAKQLSTMLPSVEKSDSQVSQIAKCLPFFPGTVLKSSFHFSGREIAGKCLKRISPHIVGGTGVRWESVDRGFHFFMVTKMTQAEMSPECRIFRQHSVNDVQDRQN